MYCPQIIYFILSFNYRYIILYNRWSIEERTMNWTNEWILCHSFLFKNRKFAFTLIFANEILTQMILPFEINTKFYTLFRYNVIISSILVHISPRYISTSLKNLNKVNEIQLQILEEGPRLRSAKNISTRNIKTFVQIFDCFDLFEFREIIISVKSTGELSSRFTRSSSLRLRSLSRSKCTPRISHTSSWIQGSSTPRWLPVHQVAVQEPMRPSRARNEIFGCYCMEHVNGCVKAWSSRIGVPAANSVLASPKSSSQSK